MKNSDKVLNNTNPNIRVEADLISSFCEAPDDEFVELRCSEVDTCDECPWNKKNVENLKKTEDENGCFCNDGTRLDDSGNDRCVHCDRIVGTPHSRYWDKHDPDTMSGEDWDIYNEIDWS